MKRIANDDNVVDDNNTTTPKRRSRGRNDMYDAGIGRPVEYNNEVNEVILEYHNVVQQQNQVTITPATTTTTSTQDVKAKVNNNNNIRRKLFPDPLLLTTTNVAAITPSRTLHVSEFDLDQRTITPSPAKRKLHFGKSIPTIKDNVKQVYSIIHKLTGCIGGNCSFGPIYGELTKGSMQKIINLMKVHTNFNRESYFIDVGSGIGKPNLHVTQDPGVALSYGIEVESDRWLLGMNCLKGLLDAVSDQKNETPTILNDDERLLYNCIFVHGDIMDANTFDPFTHVYMFSIGFPPKLWNELSKMWNNSKTPYMICYHSPRLIIDRYNFQVELVIQTPTSMHGSSEGHMGYIYQRTNTSSTGSTMQSKGTPEQQTTLLDCDPYYAPAIDIVVNGGYEQLQQYVNTKVKEQMGSKVRRTRSKQN